MYDLKEAQMTVQYSLIQDLMHYELEMDCYTVKVTKNICVKGEVTVNHSTVTR